MSPGGGPLRSLNDQCGIRNLLKYLCVKPSMRSDMVATAGCVSLSFATNIGNNEKSGQRVRYTTEMLWPTYNLDVNKFHL